MSQKRSKFSTFGIFSSLLLFTACTQFIQDDSAFPGVATEGVASSAPDYAMASQGGAYGERAPNDVNQKTFGRAGSDLASTTAPGGNINNGIASYDSRNDTGLNQNVNPNELGETKKTDEGVADEIYDPADPVEDWMAPQGSTVQELLLQWGDKAGWHVIWATDRIYTLEAGAMFRGRFMDVASALIRSFARARPAPWGTFYKGNRVLRVTTEEDENAD